MGESRPIVRGVCPLGLGGVARDYGSRSLLTWLYTLVAGRTLALHYSTLRAGRADLSKEFVHVRVAA
jgi:hypothetical protein